MKVSVVLAALIVCALVTDLAAEVDRDAEKKSDAKEGAKPKLDLEPGSSGSDFQGDVLREGQKNLEEIQKLLDNIDQDLAGKKTGQPTQAKQQEASRRLDQLIEKLSEACQKCQGGGSGQGSSQKSQSGSQQKPGEQPQGEKRENQTQTSSPKQQGQDQKKSQQDGEPKPDGEAERPDKVPNNEVAEGPLPESGKAEVVDKLRTSAVWGVLPQKMRDEMLSASGKEAPREYRDLIQRYYQRISDQYGR